MNKFYRVWSFRAFEKDPNSEDFSREKFLIWNFREQPEKNFRPQNKNIWEEIAAKIQKFELKWILEWMRNPELHQHPMLFGYKKLQL